MHAHMHPSHHDLLPLAGPSAASGNHAPPPPPRTLGSPVTTFGPMPKMDTHILLGRLSKSITISHPKRTHLQKRTLVHPRWTPPGQSPTPFSPNLGPPSAMKAPFLSSGDRKGAFMAPALSLGAHQPRDRLAGFADLLVGVV